FRYAIQDKRVKTLIARNPLIDFKVPKGKTDDRNKYIDFTRPEIRLILTKARDAEPEIKWSMWLGAYSGGRLAEIVEAMTNDVEITEDGIAVFHIQLHNRPPKRRVKNEFASRPVPLHDAVLAEGFLAYVQWVKDTFYGGGD